MSIRFTPASPLFLGTLLLFASIVSVMLFGHNISFLATNTGSGTTLLETGSGAISPLDSPSLPTEEQASTETSFSLEEENALIEDVQNDDRYCAASSLHFEPSVSAHTVEDTHTILLSLSLRSACPVTKVSVMVTATGEELLLQRTQGSDRRGVWEGSLTYPSTYGTTTDILFTAKDLLGTEKSTEAFPVTFTSQADLTQELRSRGRR
jgi:hypothetical protein